MSLIEARYTIVPLFPCSSLKETLEFYQLLGFEVTHQQEDPYLYAAVRQGGADIHFSKLSTWHSKHAVCLIFVPQVAQVHQMFADALRVKYGKVPTSGIPRITRLRPGQTRFHVFDPSGNVLLYIERDEPDVDYTWYEREQSRLAGVLDNAVFLRDTYANDKAAAQVLDRALAKTEGDDPIDRVAALAARAELAVAMGDTERARSARLELQSIPLSAEEQARFRHELQAVDDLERWLIQSGGELGEG